MAFTSELRQIEAERLLVMIDSCHAGGMTTSKEADLELEEQFDNLEMLRQAISTSSSQGFILVRKFIKVRIQKRFGR